MKQLFKEFSSRGYQGYVDIRKDELADMLIKSHLWEGVLAGVRPQLPHAHVQVEDSGVPFEQALLELSEKEQMFRGSWTAFMVELHTWGSIKYKTYLAFADEADCVEYKLLRGAL